MLRIVLIRPGSSEYDEQGRVKGTLNIPLSENGLTQAAKTAAELAPLAIQVVYSSPCQPAMETAEAVANVSGVKVRRIDKLHNLNQGLWQGKLIDEIRNTQPKVFRRWQENPETVCPPRGEMLGDARKRIKNSLQRLLKKHRSGVIGMVMPEPLASIVKNQLTAGALGNLWQAECEHAQWEVFEPKREPVEVG